MPQLSTEKLRDIGYQIQKRALGRMHGDDALVAHIETLLRRTAFRPKDGLRLILHIATAELEFRYVRYYGLANVISSLSAIESTNFEPAAAARHEKDIPEALCGALERGFRPDDPIHIRLEHVSHGAYDLAIKFLQPSENKPTDVRTSATPADIAANELLTRGFWSAYLLDGAQTEIAYGLPLFTRSGEGEDKVYTRRINVNKPADVRAKHASEDISWAFVTLGDALCMHRLLGWLQLRGAAIDTHGYDYTTDFEEFSNRVMHHAHVLVIGSPRVCGLISVYQGRLERDPASRKLPFQIGLDSIYKLDNETSIRTFTEKDRSDGLVEAPVIVTRRPGAVSGTVTMITGNHGRAVERVGDILTDEAQLRLLLEAPRIAPWAQRFPDCFQVLLSVRVHPRFRVQESPTVLDAWEESDGAELAG